MRRRLLTILIFLLAGAVVNVAVAWGCAAWSQVHQASVSEPQRIMIETAFREHFGLDENTRQIHLLHSQGFGLTIWSADRSRPYGPWSTARKPHPDYEHLLLCEAGWPLRGLNKSFGWSRSSRPSSIRKGLTRALPLRPIALPLHPIWPGFAINTVLYATILWLLIRGPFVLRRFVHMRRGLCPKCAYPMGESPVCTECGHELPGQARAAT